MVPFNNYNRISCCVIVNKIHSMYLNLLINSRLHQLLYGHLSRMDLDKAGNLFDYVILIISREFFDNFIKNVSSMEINFNPTMV